MITKIKKTNMLMLAIGSIFACVLLALIRVKGGDAEGGQLKISDLRYGAIDTDGDGTCSIGDDVFIEWAVDNAPDLLDAALQQAIRNPDGSVNLSRHLMQTSRAKWEASKTAAATQEK